MSEYYLADHRAEERTRQRTSERASKAPAQSQDVKVTLLGDFMFPHGEPQGFDPYNSVHGRSTRDAWRVTRDRR
jgi:hypothetical protein